jgi:hypothetical protein
MKQLKKAVFLDLPPCESCKTDVKIKYKVFLRLHHQSEQNQGVRTNGSSN